jgi:hypothetical protein
MPDRVHQEHQRQQAEARTDHAIGDGGGKLVVDDQSDQPADRQQRRQPAEAVVTASMSAMVMSVIVMIPVAMAALVAAAAIFVFPGVAIIAFIEGKSVAHTDVQFTHSVSIDSRPVHPGGAATNWPAGNDIIIKSSNIKAKGSVSV